jgi:hypothetical protein
MATVPEPHPTAPQPVEGQREIKIVSHCTLFYWWPVWAVGLLMALLTYIDGHYLAIVPKDTVGYRNADVKVGQSTGKTVEFKGVDVLVVEPQEGKPKQHLPPAGDLAQSPTLPRLMVAENTSFGVVYAIVLLLVITITNVPLRGLWSVVVIVIIIMGAIILALANLWQPIFETLGRLHIHINLGGYLLISLALFVMWLVTFVFFDQQIYMVFTPGQLRVRQEIGGGEMAYDTTGMVIQKQRNDLFRHWVLGLGSGDLVVNTSGATAHHFDLPNVLFVGYKVRQIEDMLREKAVVRGQR